MKKIFVCAGFTALLSVSVFAATHLATPRADLQTKSGFVQQNLIGEITSIDAGDGKLVVTTDAKTLVTVMFNGQTIFRRVKPGETSLANAEAIRIADLKIGDRVLVPGWSAANEQTAVRQIVVMPRASIEQTRSAEQEKRRARTTAGRIIAVNPEKREITVETRGGRADAETIVVAAPANAKLLRYAPDSLKSTDAVAASFGDFKIGDQIRVVGDRSTDGARVTAEEILSGAVSRSVGIIAEVNAARGEVTIKNNQTGQTTIVRIGKKTTLRRITPEVAAQLRERFERRQARRAERNANNNQQQTPEQQAERRRNRERRRSRTADGQTNNPTRRRLFDDLPAITLAELKTGDAVLITATNSGAAAQTTAVAIIAGDGELQQILLRTQEGAGGRNNSNMSPGLPGNISGGNAGSDDDDPER